MNTLRVRPHAPDATGTVLEVTPQSAGWKHVGFKVVRLAPHEKFSGGEPGRETCLVIVCGTADVATDSVAFAEVGGRATPFESRPPGAVYVPAGTSYEVTAHDAVELAVCTAPGNTRGTARLIGEDEMPVETRGSGTNTRYVRNILPQTRAADSLLVVEVLTPGGHWSSYPPHKHDTASPTQETALEETYYHRLSPAQGFAFQRVYTDDRSLDETVCVEDGDVVMVPRGYHPVGAPHGYDLYYLNVMAGPHREWIFRNDPQHDWIVRKPEGLTMRRIDHFIDGARVAGTSERHGEVFDPNTGAVQAHVAFATMAELNTAIAGAVAAQREWARVNPQRRARVMSEFKRLLEVHMDELAHLLSSEHGKVIADSRGDIQRGLEVVEFCCGVPHLMKGEYTQGAGPGIDVYSARQPLGVVAGITPFNFPAMIPMWMFGPAIAAGNEFILKPSERDPSVPVRLAELMIEAGLPHGVLNVVHGDKAVVDALLEHPAIKAVSFVGSSDIAQAVYARGALHGKRVQAMGGAKNHGIVLPDADLDHAVADIIGAAYGSAGERCMALPVVVPVGEATANELRRRLVAAISELRVGRLTRCMHYGPVVSAAHKAKIAHYIQTGVDEGAELVVDGRGLVVPGHEEGFFLGPSLFDHVRDHMLTYREEIFGPVLQIVRAESFEQALSLPSRHQYGNGVAIFTRNGDAAREFADQVDVGMVGINVPIPVPVAYHSFGGWKRSGFADLNQYGQDGIRFYTRTKTITQRWPKGVASNEHSFVIPTMR